MKPGRRDLAASALVGCGLLPVASAWDAGHSKAGIKVLAYHRVIPKIDEKVFPYDLELISAWQEEFDWQVGLLAKDYDVITCRDLAALLDAGLPVPRRAVIITFDDGYRDNHSIVLPILRRHQVAAVVFVATGSMGKQETFWYDRLLHDVLLTQAETVRLNDDGEATVLGVGSSNRRHAARHILQHLKALPNTQRLEMLVRLQSQLGVSPSKDQREFDGPMSWSQVQELSEAGVEIGSHSVTHPVLSRIGDPAQLKRELTDSKSAIEAQTAKPVISLAYPVGGATSYNDNVVRAAQEAGYRFAFTYQAGPNASEAFDPYRIRRLSVERYVSRPRFRAMLAAPALFAYGWSNR